jgi:DNA polymerase III subunit delta'
MRSGVSFKDIQGQDRAISFLKSSIENGRIPHSYIFYGPGGVGKKLAAVNFAKALNCLGAPDGRPCDSCVPCRKADSSNHPDLMILKPEKEGGSIAISDVRALIKDANLKPYEAKKKFYIIDEADGMKEEAANALLKTLEEPPSDSVFILIADSLKKLPATIVSRSQVVKFFPLRTDEVKDILVKRYDVDPDKAHVLSHLSAGRLGDALKYADEEFFAKRDKVMTALANRTFFESDFDKLSKADLKIYLTLLLTWYRDILITKALGGEGPEVVNIDRKDAILSEAAKTGFDRVEQMIRQIVSTYSFVEQNVNPKLAMAALGVSV